MWAREWMRAAGALIRENRERLIELDRAIGDGDHGENLDRAFRSAHDLDLDAAHSAGDYLRLIGSAMTTGVSGVAGPLMGGALTRMAEVADDELTTASLSHMLDAGTAAIQSRGHVSVGEKTMYDTWVAVADRVHLLTETGAELTEVVMELADVASDAAEATAPMVATKGRAAYLGEDSVGHIDPGAASSALLFQALAEVVGERV